MGRAAPGESDGGLARSAPGVSGGDGHARGPPAARRSRPRYLPAAGGRGVPLALRADPALPPPPEETEVPTMGDLRWTPDLLQATWMQADSGRLPARGEYRVGKSGGGFDILRFTCEEDGDRTVPQQPDREIDIALDLNRRRNEPQIAISLPWYGGCMSCRSVSLQA